MRERWHAEKAGKWECFWKDEPHDPSAPYLLTECVEISKEERRKLELDVVEEESIKLVLDGRHLVTLLALPRELRELAVGFLICEGVLKGFGYIRSIYIQEDISYFAKALLNPANLNCGQRSEAQAALASSHHGMGLNLYVQAFGWKKKCF